MSELPYIRKECVTIVLEYNQNYGDDRLCQCGHEYYRHFDTYEDMKACGCKYCDCWEFIQAGDYSSLTYNYFDKQRGFPL